MLGLIMASERQISEVRDKISSKKIKLWLPPFTVDGQDKGCYSQEFVEELMLETNFSKEVVLLVLEHLRCHAISKLASRSKFQETGLATLKIKIISGQRQKVPEKMNLEISLYMRGEEFKEKLSSQIDFPASLMKVIAHGKVLQDNLSLGEQNIKHESQLMVLLISDESSEDKEQSIMHQTKQDAELLSSVDVGDPNSQHYLQVADQTGKPLDLPLSERKALAVALALHQKGRNCAKNRMYSQALLYFLEADAEFQLCSAEILKLVDNYGLLNLDIAWCYLCLRSVVHLPNAVSRLASCESCLYRSYGTNLERLNAIKGGSGKELVLFARLHLLQGIVAYHQNNYQLASSLLQRAAEEMKSLKVDDEKLSQMVEMGYDVRESRLALRGAQGNVPIAIQHIHQNREMKAELRKQEKEQRKQKRMQKELGKTINGEWINIQFYNMLCSMGYSHSESVQSLQQSNNNVSLAVHILQEQRHLLATTSSAPSVSDENVAKLTSLGIDLEAARAILEKTFGNVDKAIEKLNFNLLNHVSYSDTKLEETKQAMVRLADDIPQEEEEYLDNTMTEEEAFLAEYLALL